MRMKFDRVDILPIAAVAAIFYFRNWQAILFFVVVFAYAALRYYKAKKGEPPADSNEFLIEKEDETFFTAELDIGLDYRSKPNYFRTDYRFDTLFWNQKPAWRWQHWVWNLEWEFYITTSVLGIV